jgi:hypothetical protein
MKTPLFLFCALALVGCSSDKNKDPVTGTTTTEAAEALTKAIAFTGGVWVDGLIPASNSSDVSLLPAGGDTVEPGADSLMSFDVVPGGTAVDSALLQFTGASRYVKVKSGSFGGAPADAAMSSRRVMLSYAVNDSVCTELCDTTYDLKVTQAVSWPKGRVSKHVTTTVTLDCRNTGDHAKCGTVNKADKTIERDGGTSHMDAGHPDSGPADAGLTCEAAPAPLPPTSALPLCSAATLTCLKNCSDATCWSACVAADTNGADCPDCLVVEMLRCGDAMGCHAQSVAFQCCTNANHCGADQACGQTMCSTEWDAFNTCYTALGTACQSANLVCFPPT